MQLLIVTSAWAGPTILILGDSLSAGHGIDSSRGWARLLQQRLHQKGYRHSVVNASISGDVSAGALARLPQALQRNKPVIVIVEIGGNDGLQGLPLAAMKKNLSHIITASKKRGALVLLLGIRLPPNYGPAYINLFHNTYQQVARQKQVVLVPYFLQGVAGKSELMQQDGIHPRVEGQMRMLDNVWPRLEPMLRR